MPPTRPPKRDQRVGERTLFQVRESRCKEIPSCDVHRPALGAKGPVSPGGDELETATANLQPQLVLQSAELSDQVLKANVCKQPDGALIQKSLGAQGAALVTCSPAGLA
eukprot:5433341-Amphidinium_carterae.1